jgi:hypothetical protein
MQITVENIQYIRFKVSTVVTMKSTILWDTIACSLVEVHQPAFHMLANHWTMWHHIPEDNLHDFIAIFVHIEGFQYLLANETIELQVKPNNGPNCCMIGSSWYMTSVIIHVATTRTETLPLQCIQIQNYIWHIKLLL